VQLLAGGRIFRPLIGAADVIIAKSAAPRREGQSQIYLSN
jgi:hypothetical protein